MRFEANLIKQNEALYLQNKVNCEETMRAIERQYGPFSEEEINLLMTSIMQNEDGTPVINGFQKQLIFDLFYKYFKDRQTILAINRRQYAEMIIVTKRILKSKNMILLPYILSGKVEKLVSRKSVNKKELLLIENSPTYPSVIAKYENHDIEKDIQSINATIISSDFSIVDLDPNIHGKRIEVIPAMIIEEVLMYIMMC